MSQKMGYLRRHERLVKAISEKVRTAPQEEVLVQVTPEGAHLTGSANLRKVNVVQPFMHDHLLPISAL